MLGPRRRQRPVTRLRWAHGGLRVTPKLAIERLHPRRQLLLHACFRGFTNVDLIEWLNANIAAQVATDDDGLKIDMEDLGATAVVDVRPDHVDIGRLSARGNAADALENLQNGLLTSIRQGPLPADNLPEQMQGLTAIFAHAHRYLC